MEQKPGMEQGQTVVQRRCERESLSSGVDWWQERMNQEVGPDRGRRESMDQCLGRQQGEVSDQGDYQGLEEQWEKQQCLEKAHCLVAPPYWAAEERKSLAFVRNGLALIECQSGNKCLVHSDQSARVS